MTEDLLEPKPLQQNLTHLSRNTAVQDAGRRAETDALRFPAIWTGTRCVITLPFFTCSRCIAGPPGHRAGYLPARDGWMRLQRGVILRRCTAQHIDRQMYLAGRRKPRGLIPRM